MESNESILKNVISMSINKDDTDRIICAIDSEEFKGYSVEKALIVDRTTLMVILNKQNKGADQ